MERIILLHLNDYNAIHQFVALYDDCDTAEKYLDLIYVFESHAWGVFYIPINSMFMVLNRRFSLINLVYCISNVIFP